MPLVSVIMPSYNYGRYLAEAIESVLGQTFADLELIVIDDASRDDSAEIIERYRKADARVRPVWHRSNMGIARTLNEGIGLSSGRFVALIASDDRWSRDKLEKQLDILRNDENLVVWTEGEIIDRNGRPVRKKGSGNVWQGSLVERLTGVFNRDEDAVAWSELEALGEEDPSGRLKFTGLIHAGEKRKSGDIFDELLCGNYVLGSSLIFKKDNLKGTRFNPDLKYLNDFLFNLELSVQYRFYFIDEPLTGYRLHGKNSTLRDNRGWDSDLLKTNTLLLSRYGPGIPRKLRSRLLCDSARIYAKMGQPGMAFRYLYHGIRANPSQAYNVLIAGYWMAKTAYRRDYYRAEGSAGSA